MMHGPVNLKINLRKVVPKCCTLRVRYRSDQIRLKDGKSDPMVAKIYFMLEIIVLEKLLPYVVLAILFGIF